MRVAALVLVVLLVAGCKQAETMGSTGPSPATESEMEVFCATWNEVRNRSFYESLTMLLEVAPEEIEAQITRQLDRDPATWSEDLDAIDKYTARCVNQP